jgi:ATP-dependent Zn protease
VAREVFMNSTIKNLMGWILAALVIFLFWSISPRIQKNERQLSFSDFVEQLERGHVANVTITGTNSGSRIDGQFKNGQSFRTFAPPQTPTLLSKLLGKGVVVNARDANSSSWLGHIISWTPIAIMVAFLIFFMRQMQNSPEASLAERRLRAKARVHELLSRNDPGLSQAQISESLNVQEDEEFHTILYQMLREGTIVFTSDKKYRAKTVD